MNPLHTEARAAMLRLSTGAIADGADPERILPQPLSESERTLADAWAARARDPRELAAGPLEARLAAIPLRHPLGTDAARLRVQGRLASGDPALVKDAVELANATLGNRGDPSSILLIAETAAAAGDPVTVLKTLAELAEEIDARRSSSRALLVRARELARATPADDPNLYWQRSDTLRKLGVAAARPPGAMERMAR